MLRECRRVLRPGGRLGVLVIETVPGLDPAGLELAGELGPSAVCAEASLEDMVRDAGLEVSHCVDVTEEFTRTVRSVIETLAAEEAELRDAEGAEAYEGEADKKWRMDEAITRRLVRRTLVIALRD